jgi:anti-anti-sigma factor
MMPNPTLDSGTTVAAPLAGLRWWVRQGRPPRLIVTGEIDLVTSADFERAVAEAAHQHQRLIIDLTGVEFLHSSGIRTLYAHLHSLVAVLVTPDRVVARALSTVSFPYLIVVAADQHGRSPTTPNPTATLAVGTPTRR